MYPALIFLLTAASPSPSPAFSASISGRDLHLIGPAATAVRLYSAEESLIAEGTLDDRGVLILKGAGDVDPMLRIVEVAGKRRALSELFPATEIETVLPERISSGLAFHPHVRVTKRTDHSPVEGIDVDISIRCGKQHNYLGKMKSDRDGVAQLITLIEISTELEGACVLSVLAAGARLDREVTIVRGLRLMVSVDRPVYQPGDEIFLRGLALDQATGRPISGVNGMFELVHANGAVLARRELKGDRFGLYNSSFRLERGLETPNAEVRLTIQGQVARASFRVGRFTPARVMAAIALDKKAHRPGEKMKAQVTVTRLDGGPTAGANVRLTLESPGGALLGQFGAIADDAGVARFTVPLGDQLDPLLLRAKAELATGDTAEHTREVVIDAGALVVYAVPESGAIVPRVENGFWLVTVAPDGTPLAGKVTLHAGEESVVAETDEHGIGWAVLQIPENSGIITVHASALEREATATLAVPRPEPATQRSLLLHVDPPIIGADHHLTVELKIDDPRSAGTAIVDVVAENHPVISRVIALDRGENRASIEIPAGIAGTMRVHAWHLSDSGEVAEDTRIVLVDDRRDLNIQLTPKREIYRPGEEASIEIKVTDTHGAPKTASLGLIAVDEGLRAFGLEDPQLERAIARLGGFWAERPEGAPDWAERALFVAHDRRKLAVLSSAALADVALPAREESGPARASAAAAAFQNALDRRAKKIARALERYYHASAERRKTRADLNILVGMKLLSRRTINDPWMRAMVIEHTDATEAPCGGQVTLNSSGVDGIAGSEDDISAYAEFHPDPTIGCGFGGGFGDGGGIGGLGRRGTGAGGGGHARGIHNYAAPKIRSEFPSTLAVVPSLITDSEGRATWRLKLADSLTRWVLQARGVSAEGGLGGAEAILRVEQTFFVDVHLPPLLTREDELEAPIEVTNNSTKQRRVTINARAAGSLSGEMTRELTVAPRSSAKSTLRIRAAKIGEGTIYVEAIADDGISDAVKRKLLVEPEGVPVSDSRAGRVAAKTKIRETILVANDGVPGSERLTLRLYPSNFGAVVEGLDALLEMPSGCFEQTSATTYPNALVLDYLQRTKRSNPEVKLRANAMLEAGWQRLKSYEVQGGGFSWFGDAPANRVLTAFGIMEFAGIARVHTIDPAVAARTRSWLFATQKADGSFAPDENYLHAESWSRVQNASIGTTAYITWALARYGAGPELDRAAEYLKTHTTTEDAYVQALVALALTTLNKEDPAAIAARAKLATMATKNDAGISWHPKEATHTHAEGDSAIVESTALATLALYQGGDHPLHVQDGLRWLLSVRSPGGGWSTTQATVLSLEALLETEAQRTPAIGTVAVRANNRLIDRLTITAKDADIAKKIELPATKGAHKIELTFEGNGVLQYQLASTRHTLKPAVQDDAPLDLTISFDRREAEVGGTIHTALKLTAKNKDVRMPTISVGLPAGFELDDRRLAHHPALARHETLGRRVILYLTELGANQTVDFELQLRAKHGGNLSAGVTSAWPYYDPEEIRRVDGGRFTIADDLMAGR